MLGVTPQALVAIPRALGAILQALEAIPWALGAIPQALKTIPWALGAILRPLGSSNPSMLSFGLTSKDPTIETNKPDLYLERGG